MATPRKKWPQQCDWARLDSIAAAEKGIRLLDRLIDQMTEIDQVRQAGQIKDQFQAIKLMMIACKEVEHEQ